MKSQPKKNSTNGSRALSRRAAIQSVLGLAGTSLMLPLSSYAQQPAPQALRKNEVRITKLETFLVKPRWIFLKIHTDAGVTGLGEPLLEGRALSIQTAIKEIEPYLIGKDPRRVVHHWQAIYRHAFYRGGPILTSALSGIDQALWDIKGKLLGIPVYELFGGPTRDRVRIYGRASNAEDMKKRKAEGYTVIKTGVAKKQPARMVENPAFIDYAVENFAALREAGGPEMDIGIDFHGAISPQTAKVLIKALEPYQPMFIEEPCQAQNVDVLVDIARSTHLPIATGERIFTKWGFRELLEKGAASILQPDLCHAGGLTEGRLIAGMAEAYYAAIAPHNPMGPISLACGLQLAASIPNFLVQEQVSLGEGYLKKPFRLEADGTVLLPEGPGLGIELDEAALADKIGHDWTNPETYDPRDGSVVDW
ncbi:galactonate dehydratase [Cyclobacterium xiamenense]|uniref:Galactonate dehydratase n=1 Tax=Cyclobacterium xiamenense TaxID=1297121 RepID=A0A1H7AR31_9BACT|nr:galactonate dehydratase [Cyclobacterium xiamenense]SEJ67768.1 galactonate dehydratase [Cyclobacterium xiamenense]